MEQSAYTMPRLKNCNDGCVLGSIILKQLTPQNEKYWCYTGAHTRVFSSTSEKTGWIEMNWSNKDPAQVWSLHQIILRMLTDSAHRTLKLETLIQWRAQSMFSTSAGHAVYFGGFVSVSDRWRWWKFSNLTRHEGWFISKSNLKVPSIQGKLQKCCIGYV